MRIINETVTPDNPFETPEDHANLSADIVLVGYDSGYREIRWDVWLKDSNGEEVELLESGYGTQVNAVWDGTVEDVPVEDPGSYSFEIQASACPGGGGVERSVEGVRGQLFPRCLEDSKIVPIGFYFQISAIRFGGTSDAERNEDGPYLVYDYINDSDPNNEAQWEKEEDKMVPVVMKSGTSLYAAASFQVLSLDDPAQNLEIKARVNLNGQERLLDPEVVYGSIAGRVALGTATLHLALPEQIGRYSVPINWEVTADLSSGRTIQAAVKTPEQGGHMVYTVFGEQPGDTMNTGASEEESYIWYHPDHFRDTSAQSSPGLRSPLDLATHWASSSTTPNKALEMVAFRLYDLGGYRYTPNTGLAKWDFGRSGRAAPEVTFDYRTSLENFFLECNDAACQTKIMANYLGLPAAVMRIEPPSPTLKTEIGEIPNYIFTNYLKMVGETAS